MRALKRRYLWLGLGGGALVLQGCDPNVRDTILGGVEGATTGLTATFIQAFFESLAADEEVATIVMATEQPEVFLG